MNSLIVQEALKLGDIVTISHPLFMGCEGEIIGGQGNFLYVDFTDFEDHINKKVFFETQYLTKKPLTNI